MFCGILKVLSCQYTFGIERILELFRIVLETMQAKPTSSYIYKKVFPFPCVPSIGVLRHSQSSKLSVYIEIKRILEFFRIVSEAMQA